MPVSDHVQTSFPCSSCGSSATWVAASTLLGLLCCHSAATCSAVWKQSPWSLAELVGLGPGQAVTSHREVQRQYNDSWFKKFLSFCFLIKHLLFFRFSEKIIHVPKRV